MKSVLLFENPKKVKNNLSSVYEAEIKVEDDTQFIIVPEIFYSEKNSEKAEEKAVEEKVDGEKPLEISAQFIFEKENVKAQVLGIFNLQKSKSVKINTSSVHKASHTSCETFIKSVLRDNASFDYRGEIHIEKNAQQTTAYLHDNSLTAGENTKRNSQPILEIEANDVKASHGSTTGRIDEGQLYYLQSRGIEKAEAAQILEEAFLSGLVEKIADAEIREKVINKLKFKKSSL